MNEHGSGDKQCEATIVDKSGNCSLCGGTHYGTGRRHCPYECELCTVKTDPCTEEGCPRNARWVEEIKAAQRGTSAPSHVAATHAHDWQPDGGKVTWESHPHGEALHVHTTCSKCGARAWFVEFQWEFLTKGCLGINPSGWDAEISRHIAPELDRIASETRRAAHADITVSSSAPSSTRLMELEREVAALRLLEGMDALECSALGTFLKGADIPATIEATRGVLVKRMLEAERAARSATLPITVEQLHKLLEPFAIAALESRDAWRKQDGAMYELGVPDEADALLDDVLTQGQFNKLEALYETLEGLIRRPDGGAA